MYKAEQLKAAVSLAARELITSRKHTPDLVASSSYLVEDISTSYELKVLTEELRKLKSLVNDLRSFEMEVSDMQLAKIEVMEVRITALKGFVSSCKKADYIHRKAVEKRVKMLS